MMEYQPRYEKSYALAIGIDTYRHADLLPPLSTARLGAEAVAEILNQEYAFDEVVCLLDEAATKSGVEDAYTALRARTGPDDRLVIYFAGHGIGIKGTVRTEGWLAAYDSDHTRHHRLIRMQEMTDPNYTRAKHVLAILDTCHSGLALTYEAPRAPAAPRDPRRAVEHFLARRSYQVLASANPLETATDAGLLDGHTPFTGYLLRALRGDESAARDPVTGLLTADSVAQFIRNSMAASFRHWQGPQAGILPGDGGGVLVWQTPGPFDRLPERLQRAFASDDADTRYLCVGEAERLLDDPRHAEAIRDVLNELVLNDPDREVRRRALEALRRAPTPAPVSAEPEPPPIVETTVSEPPTVTEVVPPEPAPQPTERPRPEAAARPSAPEKSPWSTILIIAATWALATFLRPFLWSIAPGSSFLERTVNLVLTALSALITMRALRRVEPSIKAAQLWTATISWAVADLISALTIGSVLLRIMYQPTAMYFIGIINGAIAGLIVGLVLRRAQPAIGGPQIATLTGGWAGGALLAEIINHTRPIIWFGTAYIRLPINTVIGGAVAATIGGGVTVWLLNRAQSLKSKRTTP